MDKLPENAHIAGAGLVESQRITETLEPNYMPYAMSVIMSRAIPENDGFKPSHRKLLYTMYKMGLLTGARTKSANIVGATMKLNPHGDAAIYETMVRLSRGYQALLHPFVDSKGNFGRAYSSDMEYAASRYTEAKLDPIAGELFRDIDKDTVDFVDNYDATMKEPTLLPVGFPTILVNNNMGIADVYKRQVSGAAGFARPALSTARCGRNRRRWWMRRAGRFAPGQAMRNSLFPPSPPAIIPGWRSCCPGCCPGRRRSTPIYPCPPCGWTASRRSWRAGSMCCGAAA